MIDTFPFLVLAAAFALGGFAQGTTGIGFALVAAPICAVLLPAEEVVGTVVRLGLLMDVALAFRGRRSIDLRVAGTYVGAALLATPLAVAVGAVAPAGVLVVGLALVTLAAALAMLVAGPLGATPVVASPSPGPQVLAGFTAGFMGVTTGMPGPPVALESARRHTSPARNRATLAVFFACVDLVASIANPHALPAAPMAVLAVAGLGGLLLAAPAAARVEAARARRLVAAVVVVSAVVALGRQVL